MYNIAAVFAPGFENVIQSVLKDVIPDADKITVSSGFVRFCVTNRPFRAVNADFFNNSFLILKEWNSPNLSYKNTNSNQSGKSNSHAPSFEAMANKIRIPENILPEIMKQNYKSFRLRFSKENVFTSVNKQVMANVEKQISIQTGMKADRLGGSHADVNTEFWFLTRADGYACFALRMTKKQSTEKYLEKGELRPEFVTLLSAFAGITKSGARKLSPEENSENQFTILDPFAGHGGIVKRVAEIAPNAKIIGSEIDAELVKKLQKEILQKQNAQNKSLAKSSEKSNVVIHQADASNLVFVKDKSVDVIITDPPWGFFQGDLRDDKKLLSLYESMLKEFERIIKPDGTICILTGAKNIFEEAAEKLNLKYERNDVLVNGKKAAVYIWKNNLED